MLVHAIRDADTCDSQGRHVRRIHYSSAACLFVKRYVFLNAGGFNDKLYEAYFEDTHLQMHIRHKQHKLILYR